jgi:hypothetical protein
MSFLLPCLWQTANHCNLVFFWGHCLCHSFCHTCNKHQAYVILFFFSCHCLCPSLCHACDKKHASAILLYSQATVYLFHNYFEKLCEKKHFNCVQSFIHILSVQWGLELPWNCLFSYCKSVYSPNWINKPGTIMIHLHSYAFSLFILHMLHWLCEFTNEEFKNKITNEKKTTDSFPFTLSILAIWNIWHVSDNHF